jgi:hypothetical protein
MRLKEAFTLQNKIQSLYEQTIRLLKADTFASRQVVRMYSKAHISNDVTEDMPVNTAYLAGDKRYEFDKLVDIAQGILDDKYNLTIAIEKAKAKCKTNYDALKQGNVVKQFLINSLSNMEDIKSFQVDGDDQAYGKDNEGKPAVYRYPTRTITTYDIDKDHLKAILRRLKNEFNEASLTLDELALTVNVEFTPKYDYDSSLEQIYLES